MVLVWALPGCGQSDPTPPYEFTTGGVDTGGVTTTSGVGSDGSDTSDGGDVTTGSGTTDGGDSGTTEGTSGDDVVEPAPDLNAAVEDFVGRLLGDPAINGYYLNQGMDVGRLKNCLVVLLQAPVEYPTSGCKSIGGAHDGMGISQADVDDWVAHLQETLDERGFDAAAIVGQLGPQVLDVIEDPTNDGTLYQRVGRKPALTAVVETATAAMLANPEINGFFDDSLLRLQTCLVRQLCALTGGPCVYGEGTEVELSNQPCRDMGTVHEHLENDGLPITLDDFDAVIGHFAEGLVANGIAAESEAFATIVLALADLCPAILGDAKLCE